MLPPLAPAETSQEGGAGQHWLRLALPSSWLSPVEQERDRPAWHERLGPIDRALRQFLRAYAAALLAALTFIA